MTKEAGKTRSGIAGRVFSLGSVMGAFTAGICCLAPLVFPLLGLGTLTSLWLLRNLVPYRNVFFGVTFLFLGLGFYSVYRRGGKARTLNRVILWASTLLTIALMGYTLYLEGLPI